jgi:hypothetical protein
MQAMFRLGIATAAMSGFCKVARWVRADSVASWVRRPVTESSNILTRAHDARLELLPI